MTRSSRYKRSTNGCGVCRSVRFSSSSYSKVAKRKWLTNALLGCSTRHIRCDETRPSCSQCTKTGRSCEGYRPSTTRLASNHTRALAPLQAACERPLSSQSHLSAPAQRALQYYRVNTAKHLSGYFDDELWTTLVLQVGHRDYSISYALVALASLHEHFHTEAIGGSSLTPRQPRAASQHEGCIAWSLPMHHAVSYYSEAVRGLHSNISTKGGDELEVTLLCCLLLAGFELLRGHHEAAQIHLYGSASLLQACQDKQKSNRGGSFWSPQSLFIRERLRPLCHRMTLQATLFSHVGPTASPSSPFQGTGAAFVDSDDHQNNRKRVNADKCGISLASPTEARDTLYRLIWQLYLSPEVRRHEPNRTRTKKARDRERDDFITSLHQWHKALSDYLERHPIDGVSSTMLKLFDAAARVIIPNCMSDDQMAFDDFAAQFHEMTDLAENLLSLPPPLPPPTPPLSGTSCGQTGTGRAPPLHRLPPVSERRDVSYFFSLDVGVLHLLYYVAIRCRVARTRFRALALLHRAQARREGVWDGTATALVASRVVALEEQARQQGVDTVDEGVDVDGLSSGIPPSARVSSVWAETDLENRKVMLRCGWQRDMACSEELLAW